MVHDTAADAYLVSNVVGEGMDFDGLGFVSRIDARTLKVDRHFIRSGSKGVLLNAPKGMAIVGDVLFVADLDRVRRFDRRRGTPLGEIPIPGAKTLNGMCADAAGNVFVSNPGWTRETRPNGRDAVWRIDPSGRPHRLASGPSLGEPNGLECGPDGLHFVSWRQGVVRRVDPAGKVHDVLVVPHTLLDGLVRHPKGGWLVTSWETAQVYWARPSGVERITAAHGSAALGLDRTRNRLLLPAWYDGTVRIRRL